MPSAELARARSLLAEGRYTLVLVRGDLTETDTARGIEPLLSRLDGGSDYRGYAAADKVVGKAAAFLYVLLGIRELHAETVSELALQVLSAQDISVTYTTLTPRIRNRTATGDCPMETAVLGCTLASEALSSIRTALSELRERRS